jgi:hypothetical protein
VCAHDCRELAGSWHLRRSAFRLLGEPHSLLVLSPLGDLLREQEREAWKRLIRVLGHEINKLETLDLADCVHHAVECEQRLAVEVRGGPTLSILADRNPLEQL